jgi:carboxypeptidase family protein/TonB-dependent receptor-like protein
MPLRAQVTLIGTITDSVAHRPLAGTLVQIMRDSSRDTRSAHSDSLGLFRFDSLQAGSYIIGFFDPMLDTLGIELTPKRIIVGPNSPTRVDLGIPSPKTITASLCATTAGRDSAGLLLGHLRDAESGLPRAGNVTVSWMELSIGQGGIHRNRQQYPTKTDAMGWYALCGVPSDVDVTVSARADSLESGVVEVRVPAGGILIRDFLVSRADSMIAVFGDSTTDSVRTPVVTLRRGHARVTGLVRNDKRQPVANAEVSVPGTGVEQRTGDSGEFSLGGLPSGTQTLEIRAIGFEPKRIIVDLTPAHLTTVDAALDRHVQTLDVTTIYGNRNRSIAEFERRLHAGWGHILTPADIAKRNALNVSDLFRTIPGVRVAPTRGFGSAVLLRGGCRPTVYLNGMRLSDDAATTIDELASPSEITAVEVYNTASRPAEFWGNNCGSVVLWAGMLPR